MKRLNSLFQFSWPVILVGIIVVLLAITLNTSQKFEQAGRQSQVVACRAVHDSNVATANFLESSFKSAGTPDAKAEAFVDGLRNSYEDIYTRCLILVDGRTTNGKATH